MVGGTGGLDSSKWRCNVGAGDSVSYDGTKNGDAVGRGFKDLASNKETQVGGIGGVQLTATTRGILLQATSKAFTPGFIEFREPYISVATTDVTSVVDMEFAFWHLNTQNRASKWKFGYYSGTAPPKDSDIIEVPAGFFETPGDADASANWEKQKLNFVFPITIKKGDTHFYGRFSGNDLAGQGTRDAVAISDVGSLITECQDGKSLCPCKGGTSCDEKGDSCKEGKCQKQCPTNGLGCPCKEADRGCDAGLQCTPKTTSFNICTPGGCLPGEPGCVCLPNGKCNAVACGNDGKCIKNDCPSMSELLMQCDTKCPHGYFKCSCRAGSGATITCKPTPPPTLVVITTATTKTTSEITTAPQPTDPPTAAAGTAAPTDSQQPPATPLPPPKTTSPPKTTFLPQTTTPLPDCNTFACEMCLVQPHCDWCGNQFGGTCQSGSAGLSCGFEPVSGSAGCPKVITEAPKTTVAPTTQPVVAGTTASNTPAVTTQEQTTDAASTVMLSIMSIIVLFASLLK